MPTVFISDSFTESTDTELSQHSPEVGGAWSKHPSYSQNGTVVASEGRVRGDSTSSSSVYINSTVPPSADYEVAWTARFVSLSNARSGVVARMNPSVDTGYYVYHDNSTWVLVRSNDGTHTTLATYNGSESLNTDYAMRLFCVGNTIEVYIDGVVRMSVVDFSPIFTAGLCGPICRANGRVDDFVAQTIGESTGSVRVTQAPVLALTAGAPQSRITQAAVLAMAEGAAVRITQAAVLAMGSTGIPVRVTQAAVLVLGVRRPCAVHEGQCWLITRTDGVTHAFTTHDAPVTFRGVTYQPCASLRASASVQRSSTGFDTGDIQAEGIIDDDAISARDLASGAYDGARVEVWEVDWTGARPTRRVTQGLVDVVEHDDVGYKLTVLTPGARLSQQPLLPVITPACRWELGDSRCTVNIEALKETGTVTAVESRNVVTQTTRRRWADTSLSAADGYYDQGTVIWLTGSNAPRMSRVKSYEAGVVTLWEVLPNEVTPGDTYDIYPGCDKLKQTCIDKFSNFVNFGGFPDLPGIDAISQTPNAHL